MTTRIPGPVQPITPDEIAAAKIKVIPPFVIAAFNHCIATYYVNGKSAFTQATVVDLILTYAAIGSAATNSQSFDESQIFEEHWLDVEEIYESAGWKVEYDKPSYNESGAATFKFLRKR